MSSDEDAVRVLYSFPHKLGAGRICYTAWQQVHGLAAAGARVLVHTGVVHRPVPEGVVVRPTLARGRLRIPYKLLGTVRACALHDRIVARRLTRLAGHIDIVHTWALGARETLKTAARLGIPTVLERPNAHTRYAYDVVQRECDRLGVSLPPEHEHAYKPDVLAIEEEEYDLATFLLCPSDFVVRTFTEQGVSRSRLKRHIYGFDEVKFYPGGKTRRESSGLKMLFVGVCAVRKGLHFALEAWLRSSASRDGTFQIAGEFLPAYANRLRDMLAHPSVRVLGHRDDIPSLMRESDVLVLPSIEEGFGLVCTEAMGSGCVPLVSDACTDLCRHMENSLVHSVGDVETLRDQINLLAGDVAALNRLRQRGLDLVPEITWAAAGRRLAEVYRNVLDDYVRLRRDREVVGSRGPRV